MKIMIYVKRKKNIYKASQTFRINKFQYPYNFSAEFFHLLALRTYNFKHLQGKHEHLSWLSLAPVKIHQGKMGISKM